MGGKVVGVFEGESTKDTGKLHTTTASSAADRRGSYHPARRPASNPPSTRSTATSASSVAAALALTFSPAKSKQLAELAEMPAVAKECDIESEVLELRGRLLVLEAALEDYLPKRSESTCCDRDSRNSRKNRIPEDHMKSRLSPMENSWAGGAMGNASPRNGGGVATNSARNSPPRHGGGPRVANLESQQRPGPTSVPL